MQHNTPKLCTLGYMTDYNDLEQKSIEQLVDLRAWQKERQDLITAELRRRVITEFHATPNIVKLAKRANVTRNTIRAWLR